MIIKSTYYLPSIENINTLIKYLYSLGEKRLSVSIIRQNIFETRIKTRNFKLFTSCHIQAAALYLNYLITHELASDYEESVQTTIADLIPAIKELDPEEDCSFIIISTNSLPSSLHYKHAKWIFYKNTLSPESQRHYEVDILVLYALRLSLEKRILGFLGIESISSNGKPIPLSRLIPIVIGLKNVEYNVKIKWDEITLVNIFLNYFMHRHRRPYPWIIHQAFEVLNPLLLPGKITIGQYIYGSIYSSTIVIDEVKLQSEIDDSIKSKFSDCKIKWLHNRDILLVKNDDRLEKK